jgi:hypothetical protein
MTIDEVFSRMSDGWFATATLVTNQDDGRVSYAQIGVHYRSGPREATIPIRIGASLHGEGAYFFNDRTRPLQSGTQQPFTAEETDPIDLTLRRLFGRYSAVITLKRWGDAAVHVPLDDQGDVLAGVGDPIGLGDSAKAHYLITLSEPHEPPR